MLQIKEIKESYTKYAYYTHNGCYIPDWNTIILMLHENMHITRTYSNVVFSLFFLFLLSRHWIIIKKQKSM